MIGSLIHNCSIYRDGGSLTDGVYVSSMALNQSNIQCRLIQNVVTERNETEQFQVQKNQILFDSGTDVLEEDEIHIETNIYQIKSVIEYSSNRARYKMADVLIIK